MASGPGGRHLLIGTCNWADHTDFYPTEFERSSRQREKLSWYAQYFPLVEVDSSFYRIPTPPTTRRWTDEVPEDFTFNVKAFRTLTGHGLPDERRSEPTEAEEAEFEAALAPLREAGKLGAILYQFPPWLTSDKPKNRAAVVRAVERHPGDLVAVEFRHRSWYELEHIGDTQQLLEDLGAVWVAVDAPQRGKGTAPAVAAVTNPRLALVRFHGRNAETWYRRTGSSRDRFDYDYTRDELREWTPMIEAMADEATTTHLLMNTNNRNQGPANAYRLADVLGIRLPPPPPTLESVL